MRIAIPVATGKLAAHFGHCEEFALIDVDLDQKAILAQNMIAAPPHEPGLLPGWLAKQGAEVIIAGGMGARAKQLFDQQNIRVVIGAPSHTPESVALAFLDEKLKTGPNLCDH
jgi:ATP-binding protein involved in chromosome partitioning